MKYVTGLFFLLLLCFSSSLYAQLQEPLAWETAVNRGKNKQLLLSIKATFEEGWHLYSQHIAEGGPQPTTISLSVKNGKEPLPALSWTELGHPETVYDSTFGLSLTYFSKEVTFVAALPEGWAGNTTVLPKSDDAAVGTFPQDNRCSTQHL
jgi:hypothetical protein